MSIIDFYLDKGYTPTWKTASFDAVGTITVWTPRTSTRIVLTQLVVSSDVATSVAFYFGNLAGTKITQVNVLASSFVSVPLLADSDIYDRTLVANTRATGTDGVKITVFGFEIP